MAIRRHHNSLAVWLIVLALLPAIYMLSTGPVLVLVNLGFVPKVVLNIYWPLALLREHCRPANVFFAWYESLWLDLID